MRVCVCLFVCHIVDTQRKELVEESTMLGDKYKHVGPHAVLFFFKFPCFLWLHHQGRLRKRSFINVIKKENKKLLSRSEHLQTKLCCVRHSAGLNVRWVCAVCYLFWLEADCSTVRSNSTCYLLSSAVCVVVASVENVFNDYHLIFFAEISTESLTVENTWKQLQPQVLSGTSVSVYISGV